MHLPLRRAGPDGHRRRDDRGIHLRVRRLPVLHLELPGHRHRGSLRHHRRRHLGVHPVRRLGDRGDLQPVPGAPNESALHLGSDEEASSRGSDEVHPDPEPDEGRPDPEPDDRYRPEPLPDVLRFGLEPDDRHRLGGGCPVPDAERDARSGPRSMDCCRHEAPWDRASVLVRLAWGLRVQAKQMRPAVPELLRPQKALLVQPGEPVQESDATVPAPQRRAPQAPRVLPVPVLRVPPEWSRPGLPGWGAQQAWGLVAVHRAWHPCSAWVCCRSDGRCRIRSPTSRTGTIHAVDALPALRRWTMLI